MRKKLSDDFATKAKKREIKKRPRMQMHGASLKRAFLHGGKKITAR
jgi:hypothetical protein